MKSLNILGVSSKESLKEVMIDLGMMKKEIKAEEISGKKEKSYLDVFTLKSIQNLIILDFIPRIKGKKIKEN